MISLGTLPWVLCFAAAFRELLVGAYERKVAVGYSFPEGEVKWDRKNTVRYPLVCALAGVFAGLFGVGGGIVKGFIHVHIYIPSYYFKLLAHFRGAWKLG